ncbi:glycoside hydrolase family 3 N-terminal domain-containing protein [Paenibacillus aquistagni]|uniref:Beta-glucosidase n=1 Tax=Paenibacillus aquistagni TaxID=1852522 RepID=A0A1X7LEP2_9BACL|nr:glycoside hydrolase family 3 N-terminal domain-containing protein [Paenibacillus aquistagni]SMG51732.1 beta-glucosidase [Paenibacillus aquistagni]
MNVKDASLPIEARVRHLLDKMTVEEKIGQLIQLYGWEMYEKAQGKIVLTDAFKKRMLQGGIGSLYGTLRADPWTGVTLETGLSPRDGAHAVNEIQRFAVEQTRLGIPILIGEECSHGHMAIGATVFPVPLAIGSAWNRELFEQMCRAVAIETRAQGGAVTYSPVLDVVRDPRWGRTEECFSEDSYLVSELGAAAVRGMQGKDLSSPDSIGVTLKHYAAYGASEGGRNAATVHIGARELHEVDLPPFEKAIAEGAFSVMTAYNEIDGVPCTSSRYLLNHVLREQWGFQGFVITDCGAIDMLYSGHNVAPTGEAASALALSAGVDMEMSGSMFSRYLMEALNKRLVSQEELDEAIRRVLDAKFRLGLFDNPYVDPERAAIVIGAKEHADIAKQVALESTILLKNTNSILPLNKNSKQKIAVIGPNADRPYNQLGDYTSPQPRAHVATVLDGIRHKLEDRDAEVIYAPGCRVKEDSREGFEVAIEAAKEADLSILVLGSSSARDFGEGTIDLRTGASIVTDSAESEMDCGEGVDRTSLRLSGVQLELAQEIGKLGKPIIIVYINGRPIVEPWIEEHADAILEAWYPGQEGGHAIADLLFGDANPSGKLSITIPMHEGQMPISYHLRRPSKRRYVEMDLKPRYAFGYGLSYTTYDYANLQVRASQGAGVELVHVQVEVTNTGQRAGQEVVQLYIRDRYSTFTRPELELKGFEKVFVEPGETRLVQFALTKEHLALLNERLERVVEPGEFIISVGPSSDQLLSQSIHIEGGDC